MWWVSLSACMLLVPQPMEQSVNAINAQVILDNE